MTYLKDQQDILSQSRSRQSSRILDDFDTCQRLSGKGMPQLRYSLRYPIYVRGYSQVRTFSHAKHSSADIREQSTKDAPIELQVAEFDPGKTQNV